MGRMPQRQPFGTLQLETPKPLDAGALFHFWYPGRDGIEMCPKDFGDRIRDEICADVEMCRPPGCAPMPQPAPWIAWYRKPQVTHWLSPGWLLLFVWQTSDRIPLPLDERVFANLYRISARAWGNAEKYFDSVVKTIKDDKARIASIDKARTDAKRQEMFASHKIKNIGSGSKFALHHDGSIVPTRGEANWLRERELANMPGEMAKATRERRKQIASLRKDRERARGRR